MKLLIYFLLLNASIVYSHTLLTDYNNITYASNKETQQSQKINDAGDQEPFSIEVPQIKSKDEIIKHTAYILSYNEEHEQANWVAYELTNEETKGKYKRTNKFFPDTLVSNLSATSTDYGGSGYDRGHLAPAADMSWSKVTLEESFYYSNMSPQVPNFNRGIWKKLEEQVRDWAREYGRLYITTGPVLKNGLNSIGKNGVSIPQYYYKVILRPDNYAIGFVMPNKKSLRPLTDFVVSVDSLEALTGLNFFPKLSDTVEEAVEAQVELKYWKFNKIKEQDNFISNYNLLGYFIILLTIALIFLKKKKFKFS